MMKRILVKGCLIVGTVQFVNASSITVAERGKPSEFSVVVPANATPSTVYAAEELRDYVRKITGVALPVVTNESPRKAVFLRVVPSPDNYDWFKLKIDDGSLDISGSERGVLYGVYEILETYGGCGWFSPTTEIVPRAKAFSVPSDLDRFEKAAFICRDTSWHDVLWHPEFAARLRLAGPHLKGLGEKFGGSPFMYEPWLGSCHSFRKLLPASKYFKEHPEYYSEWNGFREPYQPCLSNREARRIMKDNLLDCIAKNYPKYKYYTVSQNDIAYHCKCPSCKAFDDREGSPAASVLDFVNEMADVVKAKYPDVVIFTDAYMYTIKAPKTIKARDNVMVVLCTDQCDHGRKIYESRNGNNRVFVKAIKDWSKIVKTLKIWDYSADFHCFMLAHPNLKALQPNFSFFRANGASYIIAQGPNEGPHFDLADLRTWLIGKLLWNPDQPVEPLIDRFCKGYYGAAAPLARKYVDRMHSFEHDERDYPLHMCGNPLFEYVPASFYDEAAQIWAAAAKLVADDPVRARNVRWASLPVDWCRVFYSNYGALAEVTRHPEYVDTPRFRELQAAARNVAAMFREEPKSATVAEDHKLVRQMRRRIGHFATLDPATVKAADKVRMEETFAFEAFSVAVEKKDIVKRVDDPLADDGKAYRLSPVSNAKVEISMNDVHVDPDGLYKIRARIRIERVPGAEGEAFFGGVYDSSKTFRPKMILRKGCPTTAIASDGYAWYDITDAWTPVPTQTVRLSIGDWDRKASNCNSAVQAVYVDAFEIARVN